MPRRCCIPGCSTNERPYLESVNVFSFPKNEGMQTIWMNQIGLAKYPASAAVCIKHFKDADFLTKYCAYDRTVLKPGAYPTIFDISDKESRESKEAKPRKTELHHLEGGKMDIQDKDVSCFTLDGVVAEMVIEVEDSHKTGLDDLGIEISPTKSNTDSQNDDTSDNNVENAETNDTSSENSKTNDINVENVETNDTDAENAERNDINTENAETNDSNAENDDSDAKVGTNDINAENDVANDTKADTNADNDSETKKTDSQNNEQECSNQSSGSNKINVTHIEVAVKKDLEAVNNSSLKQGKIPKGRRRKRPHSNLVLGIEADNNSSSSKEEKITRSKSKTGKSSSFIEDEESLSDQPRYPGRKRQVNKKYISDDLIPGKKKRSGSIQSRENLKEEKQQNLENDPLKKKSEVNEDLLGKTSVKSSSSIDVPSNVEVPAAKKDTLRKLPFRKNKDAPDVPDLKPKVMWWNGVGEGQGVKLGDIVGMRDRIRTSRSVRALFRVLFFQWPTDGQNLIEEILKFNGFPFDKTSYEFTKRQGIMKIMLDKTLANICEILGLKKDSKQNMISKILNFLLKPHGKIEPSNKAMQPVVLLERLVLDNKFLSTVIADSKKDENVKTPVSKFKENVIDTTTPVRITRNSTPRVKNANPPNKILPAKTRKSSKINSEDKLKEPPVITRKRGSYPKELGTPLSDTETPRVGKRIKSEEKAKVLEISKIAEKSKIQGKSKNIQRTKTQDKCKKEENPKSEIKLKAESKPKVEYRTKTSEKSEADKHSEIEKRNKGEKIPKIEKMSSEELSSSEGESSVSDPENEISKIEKEIMRLKLKKKMALEKKKMAKKLDSEVKVENKEVKKVSFDSASKQENVQTGIKKLKKKKKSLKRKGSVTKTETEKSVDAEDKKALSEDALPDSAISGKDDDKSKKVAFDYVHPPSDSSETESSEEAKEALSPSPHKAVTVNVKPRVVQPLKAFPQICNSIQKASFSALQRLHILLFGASDKRLRGAPKQAENLKGNILAFGGFPFLEGSDEWKQKHFLLSLLAQNNLREYLNLLCIEHNDNDQPAMINKLMRFLAAPSDNAFTDKIPVIETEVISSELVNISPQSAKNKGKVAVKKKKKKDETPTGRRHRKVLMSEEEAKKLEANFAREQRALARDSRPAAMLLKQPPVRVNTSPLPVNYPKPPVTIKPKPIADAHQLNALLQTVYKRRALKAAGAVISTPNKGVKTKLYSIENIKFLVVTSNFTDLELLHRLIFLSDANKGRIRKNILDFDGFGFNEDSDKYKERMDLLNKFGYDVSKRLSFLLGLCPLDTKIPQQDLNELIMYFLMSPCKTKQVVPITQMPANYGYVAESKKINQVTEVVKQQHSIVQTSPPPVSSQTTISSVSPSKLNSSFVSNPITSTPIPPTERQKAKKSFGSSSKLSPLKKVLLPPSGSALPAGLSSITPGKLALPNPVNSVSLFTLPANTTVHTSNIATVGATSVVNTIATTSALSTAVTTSTKTVFRKSLLNPPKPQNVIYKVPLLNAGANLQVLNPSSSIAMLESGNKVSMNTLSNLSGKVIQTPTTLQQQQTPTVLQQKQAGNILNPVQSLLAKNVKSATGLIPMQSSSTTTQEFIVQQQTPDGQQKTFKLIRLPANHPLATAVKPPKQTSLSSPVQKSPVFSNMSLLANSAPGLIVMKPSPMQNMQNILQSVPVKNLLPGNKTTVSIAPNAEEFVLPDEGQSAGVSASNLNDPDVEVLNPLEDNPPTDNELYTSIQEIILGSNFEDITLRNVIERVSAQYSHHDLTPRHNYMKECVKKIIIGSS